MRPESVLAPPPQVSADVPALAERLKVADYITELIRMTQQVYPMAGRFQVEAECDPEVADDWQIVFRVTVPAEVALNLDHDSRWIDGLIRVCPAPLRYFFRLSVDPVE